MMRQGFVYLTAFAVAGLWGCQKDNTATNQKLDELIDLQKKTLAAIEKGGGAPGAARGAAARRPQRPQRPRPNPKAVYSVPIKGAAFKGAENAKVTVVEAFEFA